MKSNLKNETINYVLVRENKTLFGDISMAV